MKGWKASWRLSSFRLAATLATFLYSVPMESLDNSVDSAECKTSKSYCVLTKYRENSIAMKLAEQPFSFQLFDDLFMADWPARSLTANNSKPYISICLRGVDKCILGQTFSPQRILDHDIVYNSMNTVKKKFVYKNKNTWVIKTSNKLWKIEC